MSEIWRGYVARAQRGLGCLFNPWSVFFSPDQWINWREGWKLADEDLRHPRSAPQLEPECARCSQ